MKYEYLKLEEVINEVDYWKDSNIFYVLKRLIELNPTYDLNYLWIVVQSTIGMVARNEYWFGYTGHEILINRVEYPFDSSKIKLIGTIVNSEYLDEN